MLLLRAKSLVTLIRALQLRVPYRNHDTCTSNSYGTWRLQGIKRTIFKLDCAILVMVRCISGTPWPLTLELDLHIRVAPCEARISQVWYASRGWSVMAYVSDPWNFDLGPVTLKFLLHLLYLRYCSKSFPVCNDSDLPSVGSVFSSLSLTHSLCWPQSVRHYSSFSTLSLSCISGVSLSSGHPPFLDWFPMASFSVGRYPKDSWRSW